MRLRVKPLVYIACGLSVPLLFSACGGSDQDVGESQRVAVAGLALDGYLARSRVFQDLNGNGIMDTIDPRAFTDDDGYYSYNPLTDINYCLLKESDRCLKLTVGTNANIIIEGGYDLITGEPFYGHLRARTPVQSNRIFTDIDVVTPISTLLSYTTTNDQSSRLQNLLGISSFDLNRDYYNRLTTQTADNAADRRLAEVTQTIHRVVTAASRLADDVYTDFGDESDLPQSTSSYAYASLNTLLQDQTVLPNTAITATSMSDLVSSTSNVSRIVASIQAQANAAIAATNKSRPVGANYDTSETSVDVQNISKISDVVKRSMAAIPNNTMPTIESSKAALKAIEISFEKIVNKKPTTEIDSIIVTLTDTVARDNLLEELAKPSTNITSLIDTDLSNEADVKAITEIDYSPVFSNLQNKRLAFSKNVPEEDQDLSALLYFNAVDSSSTSGTLIACVRYVDGLESNGKLKSGGTLGTHTNLGSWARLNDGYAVLLDFEIAKSKRQGTVQYGGLDDGNMHIYRTDIGGKFTTWASVSTPATYVGNAPSSDAACKAELDRVDPIQVTVVD